MEGATHPVRVFTDHKNLEYFSTTRPLLAAMPSGQSHSLPTTTQLHTGASNGQPDAMSQRPNYLPPPLPSLPILFPTDPLLNTPHLIRAAVLVMPNDPSSQKSQLPRERM